MAKILNLDKLVTPADKARELVIGGKAYPIEDMTVSNFIVTTRTAEQLLKDNASIADQIEATVDAICRSVPTLDRTLLEGRSLEVLNTIAAFVRGDEIDAAEDAPEEGGTEAGK